MSPTRIVIADLLGRPLRNLRLSVTDRCNLRCEYCMPEEHYVWLPRRDILHFGETCALVDVFIGLGVDKVRVTGGEPLVRRELSRFIGMLASRTGLADLALTTNGVLLADQAEALKGAGLRRITVSLDTLRRDRFRALTRTDALDAVRAGLAEASRLWGGRPGGVKIDAVVIRGVNDDELGDLIEYGRALDAEVRFIEYMDVGGASKWTPAQVVSRREMLDALGARYGAIEPIEEQTSAPAERFRLPDGAAFGVIASTTAPFCRTCDRSRLTADGLWYTCLYAARGLDLRGPFRAGATPDALAALVADAWRRRADRGAEARLALGDARAIVPLRSAGKDPHLEMHTRGG